MPSKICPHCSHNMKNIGPFEDSKSETFKDNNIMILKERRGLRFQCSHCYYVEESISKDRRIYRPTQSADLSSVKDYSRVILAIGKNRRRGPKLRNSLAIPLDEFESRLRAMAHKGLCCFELALEKGSVEPIWVWLPEGYAIDILDAALPIDYESNVEQCFELMNEIQEKAPNTIAGEKLRSIVEAIDIEEFEMMILSKKDKPISKSSINKLSRVLGMLRLTRLIIEYSLKNSPATHADLRETLNYSVNEYHSARNALEEVLDLPLIFFGVFGKITKKSTSSLPSEMNVLLDETELNLRKLTYNVLSQRNGGQISIERVLPSNVSVFARKNIMRKLMKEGLSRNVALGKAQSMLEDDISSKSFVTVLEQIRLSHYLPIFEDSTNWSYFLPALCSLVDVKKHFGVIIDTRNVIKHVKSDPIDIIPALNSFLWLHLHISSVIR